MKIIRFAVLSVAAALVLAACSVPVPDQQVDLGLELARVPFMARPPLRHLEAGEMIAFVGTAEATGVAKVEIDRRFTMESISLPISLLPDVEVVAPEGGIPPAIYTFTGFTLTASMTDGTNSVSILPVSLPGTFEVDLSGDAPVEDFRIELGDDPFVVFMAQNLISQVNSIIVGTSGEFSFSAKLEFMSDLPEDTDIMMTLQDAAATIRGRGSL